MEKLLEALKKIPVSNLSYQEWINVGMALKDGGYSCKVWDEWSQDDDRYHNGECEKKWETFKGCDKPVTVATIYSIAKKYGYKSYEDNGVFDWDDTIGFDDPYFTENEENQESTEMLKEYIQALFEPSDIIGYVTHDVFLGEDGKWKPKSGMYSRTAGSILEDLEKHPGDIGASIGDYNSEAGAWIRFNPLDGKGCSNDNVKSFKYALVESDYLSVKEQERFYRSLRLPIAFLVYSGEKSLHAIVKVDAQNKKEYNERVKFLYDYLDEKGFAVDAQNKNCSRLSRMPGVLRNGVLQNIVDRNIGFRSWSEWVKYIEEEDDDRPEITCLYDDFNSMPELPEEIINGVLRVGHKMLVSGPSKAGKSFLLMELAAAIAEGGKWLNFDCRKGKVLYINFEIDSASCLHRFMEIYKKLGLNVENSKNLFVWNLRGHGAPLDKLLPSIIRRVKENKYMAVIIDPIYKVITGDENTASEMAYFCRQFDRICDETGASVIYCHHHSKGTQGQKSVLDRASGSGVFARDPDAVVDITELAIPESVKLHYAPTEKSTAWVISGSLREFEAFKPFKCWFAYPVHQIEKSGCLDGYFERGSTEGNLSKSYKRHQSTESRKDAFDTAFNIISDDENSADIKDLANYLGISGRTVRSRVAEFEDNYSIIEGRVCKFSNKNAE